MSSFPSPKIEESAAAMDARRAEFSEQAAGLIVKILIPFIALWLAIWLLMPRYTQILGLDAAYLVVTACLLAYRPLARRGRERAARWLMITSLLLLISMIHLLVIEVGSLMILAYVVIAGIGYIMFGNEMGAHVIGAASMALFMGISLFMDRFPPAWIQPFDPGVSFWIGLLLRFGFTVCGMMVLYVIAQGNEQSFLKFLTANREVRERAEVERAQREALNTANRSMAESAAAERAQREALANLLDQIRETVAQLQAAVNEIQAAASQQSAGANEQSAAITQTASTISEVKHIAAQTVERANTVTEEAGRTLQVSTSGQTAVQETIAGITRTRMQVEEIAQNILALSEQTQQIGEIIATVNEIADQSNMLALNASVEAARAGDQGKGFAVVAAEVRQMAEQSRQATGKVKAILTEIQKATNATVMATEEGAKGVDQSVRLATQAQQALAQLAAVIDASAQTARQVAASNQQQAGGIAQIDTAMTVIQQATTQSHSSTRQTERAAQNLHDLAGKLADLMEGQEKQ